MAYDVNSQTLYLLSLFLPFTSVGPAIMLSDVQALRHDGRAVGQVRIASDILTVIILCPSRQRPYAWRLRCLDCLVCEGPKILYISHLPGSTSAASHPFVSVSL